MIRGHVSLGIGMPKGYFDNGEKIERIKDLLPFFSVIHD
jgi:hypothetical protein